MLKKKYTVFLLFFLFLFALLTYQSINDKKHFLDFLSYPLRLLQQGSSAVISGITYGYSKYIAITGKEDENRRLLEIISRSEQEKNRFRETELENARLRELLQLKSGNANYVTSAEIFARDPSNWFQMLWINKGSDDGIAKNMVAVSSLGPVGKVHRVFSGQSSIIMLTDVNSSIAVKLQSSRVDGILEGRGDNRCTLRYIPKDINVSVGEQVITSGYEGIYPEGLLIGYVSEITLGDDTLFQSIVVMPAQDLNRVEEVMILKK